MKLKPVFLGSLIVLGIILLIAHCSAVKNVDLSWNARHLDMEDCNGMVCQDLTEMYMKSLMYMFTIEPILFGVYCVFVYYVSRMKE